MDDLKYSDDLIRDILTTTKTIAMVGASPKPHRDSNRIMKFLQSKGYRVIPVNPGQAGRELNGEMAYASLSEIPEAIDMVDVFRNSEAAADAVDDTLEVADEKGVKVIWMQLGVRNDAAAKKAEDAGLTVVMNRCPKPEFTRLFGDAASARA